MFPKIGRSIMTPTGVMTLSLSTNIFLALAKITWSHRIHSVSMLADGYHALLDSVSGILCLAALLVAQKPPDRDHPYGHIRFEALAQLGVSGLLLFTGYEVLSRTYDQFHSQITPTVTAGSYAIMLFAMAIQTVTMNLEKVVYRKTGNALVHSDAMHFQSDILSSFSVLVGLVAAGFGYPVIDEIAGLAIAILIAHSGWELMMEGTKILSDHSPLDPQEITEIALSTPGVQSCYQTRSRGSSSHITMDMTVGVDGSLSVSQAHGIAHLVESRIREKHPAVVEVIVHIEPSKTEETNNVSPHSH
jgi:cation diffusion facilitator family transporter